MDVTGIGKTPQGPDAGRGADSGRRESRYQGERVSLDPGATSLVQELAEGLDQAEEERPARRLQDRRVGVGQRASRAPSDAASSEQQRGEQQARRLLALTKLLRAFLDDVSSKPPVSASALVERAAAHLQDPSDQFAALARLKAEPPPGMDADTVSAAMALSLAAAGPAIRAGLNIVPALDAAGGADYDTETALKALYRAVVLEQSTLAGMYGAAVQLRGEAALRETVDFLLRAAAQDLAAARPSRQPEALRGVVDDLYRLEVLGGLHEACNALAARFVARGLAPAGTDGHRLLQGLLELTDADWMPQQRLHNLTQTLGLADGRGEIRFFHELRELVWQIPPKAYAEPERRDKFVRAVQDALDTLIADEA